MTRRIKPGECGRKLRDVVRVEFKRGTVIVWLIDGSAIRFAGSMENPIIVEHYAPQDAADHLAVADE